MKFSICSLLFLSLFFFDFSYASLTLIIILAGCGKPLDKSHIIKYANKQFKDAELLETRLFNVQEVARFFNISPVLLGDLSKSSYNSIEQAQLQFVINTLAPYIAMLEQEINNKLIMPSMKYNYYIDIVEEDIIKQDKQSQANYLNTLVNSGILTRNEARKKLGYPPVEGGDELMVSYSDPNQNKINQENQEDKNTDENKDEEQ